MFNMTFEKLNNKICKPVSTMTVTSARISFQNRACFTADFCVVYVILCSDACLSLFVVNYNNTLWIPVLKITLKPCFSIYFSSRKPKKATGLTCPQQVTYKLNTSIYFFLMYITCKNNQRLTSN